MPVSQLKNLQNFLPAVVKDTPATGLFVEYYVLLMYMLTVLFNAFAIFPYHYMAQK